MWFAVRAHGLPATLYVRHSGGDLAAGNRCILALPGTCVDTWSTAARKVTRAGLFHWGLACCQPCLSLDSGSTGIVWSRCLRQAGNQEAAPALVQMNPQVDEKLQSAEPRGLQTGPRSSPPWPLLPSGGVLQQHRHGDFCTIKGTELVASWELKV